VDPICSRRTPIATAQALTVRALLTEGDAERLELTRAYKEEWSAAPG
jgi:hypothetical protein